MGDLFRSPISGYSLFEGAFEALAKIDRITQKRPAPPSVLRPDRRAIRASRRPTSNATSRGEPLRLSSSGPSIWEARAPCDSMSRPGAACPPTFFRRRRRRPQRLWPDGALRPDGCVYPGKPCSPCAPRSIWPRAPADLVETFAGPGGLHDNPKWLSAAASRCPGLLDAPRAGHAAQRSFDLGVVRVADDDDLVAVGFELFGWNVNLRYHRAGGVDDSRCVLILGLLGTSTGRPRARTKSAPVSTSSTTAASFRPRGGQRLDQLRVVDDVPERRNVAARSYRLLGLFTVMATPKQKP